MRRSLPQTRAREDALLRIPEVIRKQLLGHTYARAERRARENERDTESDERG